MSVRFSSRRLRLAAGLVAAGVTVGLALPETAAAPGTAQHGPPVVAQPPLSVRNGSAHKLGAVSSAQTIRLTIGLRSPHMAAEQQFLREIQTKHSPPLAR